MDIERENLIAYETALLAKEKGFDLVTPHAYIGGELFADFVTSQGKKREYFYTADEFYEDWNRKGWLFSKTGEDGKACFGCKLDNERWFEACSAPTQSLLKQWLRKIHNIYIEVCLEDDHSCYYHKISEIGENTVYGCEQVRSYEECLEKALFEALGLIK